DHHRARRALHRELCLAAKPQADHEDHQHGRDLEQPTRAVFVADQRAACETREALDERERESEAGQHEQGAVSEAQEWFHGSSLPVTDLTTVGCRTCRRDDASASGAASAPNENGYRAEGGPRTRPGTGDRDAVERARTARVDP